MTTHPFSTAATLRPEPDCLDRWHLQLASRVGLQDHEIDERQAALDAFCILRGLTPVDLIATWQCHPELTVRRRPGTSDEPNMAVESFLIHNGINVFGEIICVPGRPKDLILQGIQFAPLVTVALR